MEPVAVRFDRGGVLHVLSRRADGLVTRIDLHGSGRRDTVVSGLVGLDNAAFDNDNRMFVSSFADGGLHELHPDGRTRQVVPGGFTGPYGVTVDRTGTILAADHYRLASPSTTDGVVTHELTTFVHGVAADGDLVHVTSQYGNVRTYDRNTRTIRVRATNLSSPLGIRVAPAALPADPAASPDVPAASPDVHAALPDVPAGSLDVAAGSLVVAESGAGRILVIGPDDEVSVLASGFERPVDVAFDDDGVCYVADEGRGAVLRIDGEPVIEGLDTPQGLTVRGGHLYVLEAGRRRLVEVELSSGSPRTIAVDLPVAVVARREWPALIAQRMPGVPRPFAGVAAGPDGVIVVAGNGTVIELAGE